MGEASELRDSTAETKRKAKFYVDTASTFPDEALSRALCGQILSAIAEQGEALARDLERWVALQDTNDKEDSRGTNNRDFMLQLASPY